MKARKNAAVHGSKEIDVTIRSSLRPIIPPRRAEDVNPRILLKLSALDELNVRIVAKIPQFMERDLLATRL